MESLDVTISKAFKKAGITSIPRIRCVLLSELRVDGGYQRQPSEAQVADIAKNFNPSACGTLIVNLRSSGGLFVVDGNHRRLALERIGAKHWHAYYHQGLSPQQEAIIWRVCNDRRKNASALEKFRQRVFIKDPDAIAITAIVEEFGCTIMRANTRRKKTTFRDIGAVAALERIWRSSGEFGLRLVLRIITESWDESEHHATDRLVLVGLHKFLTHGAWKEHIDISRLIERLKVTPVCKLLREAISYNDSFGGDRPTVFADVLWKTYNWKLKRKLPPRNFEVTDE